MVSALCLLDLLAAFDTVDHELLILRLKRQFCLRAVVLQWFSYLSDSTFHVTHSSSSPSVICVPGAVPQGSVLGRACLLCTQRTLRTEFQSMVLVTMRLLTICMQLYVQCHYNDMSSAVQRLEHCITDVGQPS